MIRGRAIKFGNNVDTDQIIGAHHLNLPTIRDMAAYAFENDPGFSADFERGDILVGGDNFGCGSSREQAVAVLKEKGVGAIVARGFARIFFRNAINLGIVLVECPEAGHIRHLEELEISEGCIGSKDTGRQYRVSPLPPFVHEIIADGGIVAHLRRKEGGRKETGED